MLADVTQEHQLGTWANNNSIIPYEADLNIIPTTDLIYYGGIYIQNCSFGPVSYSASSCLLLACLLLQLLNPALLTRLSD